MDSRGKVLIVDDDEIALEVTALRLEAMGFEVTKLDTALGTSRVVLREKPDVVLVDVNMPALSGDALAALLPKHVPFIFHTGLAGSEASALAARCGALGAIEKTGDDDEFRDRFESIFARAPSSR